MTARVAVVFLELPHFPEILGPVVPAAESLSHDRPVPLLGPARAVLPIDKVRHAKMRTNSPTHCARMIPWSCVKNQSVTRKDATDSSPGWLHVGGCAEVR